MAIPLEHDVEYPYSDGKPMAESDVHRDEMLDLITGLQECFRDRPDVYVAGNLFLYYKRGDPRLVVAPDVFLVQGVHNGQRKTYKLWEEGRVPSLVIELTSDSTRDEDLDRKMRLYQDLGIEEYFLHDPMGDYLEPPLQGYRLVLGKYRPIETNPDGSIVSRTTGVLLRPDGQRLRLELAGKTVLTVKEAREKARNEERSRREAEASFSASEAARREAEARAQAAEEELARLRAEIERLRQ